MSGGPVPPERIWEREERAGGAGRSCGPRTHPTVGELLPTPRASNRAEMRRNDPLCDREREPAFGGAGGVGSRVHDWGADLPAAPGDPGGARRVAFCLHDRVFVVHDDSITERDPNSRGRAKGGKHARNQSYYEPALPNQKGENGLSLPCRLKSALT